MVAVAAAVELCPPSWTWCEGSIGIVLAAVQLKLVLTRCLQFRLGHFEVGLGVNYAALLKFEHD